VAEAVGMLSLGVELLVGAFLIVAGIVKVRAGGSAVIAAVARYDIGGGGFQRVFARFLPWIEIGLGVGLSLPVFDGLAALGAGALLAGFALAMARSLVSGRRHPCGCGLDRGPSLISWALVLRNGVVVTALALAELAQGRSQTSLALALVFLASALSSVALHVRSRARIKQALSAPTTSRT
jgi:hypothetical protein